MLAYLLVALAAVALILWDRCHGPDPFTEETARLEREAAARHHARHVEYMAREYPANP